MTSKTFDPSRRGFFRRGAALAGGAAATGLLLKTKAYAQTSKASKAVAMYQAKPHGADDCAKCVHFIPGKTPSADGTCHLVRGSISPQGWCVFFAGKG